MRAPSLVALVTACAPAPSPPPPVTTAAPPTPAASHHPPALPAASKAPPAPSSPPAASASAPPASEGPCPQDMVAVGPHFCIDRYEAPNRKGTKPLLLQSAAAGQAWCAERGKRLCLEREWNRACRGPQGLDFPYGWTWKKGVCNDDKTWRSPRWSAIRSYPSPAADAETKRLDQSEASGSREGCVSPEGVFDLTGNVAEWVVRTEDNPTNHDHVVKGCYWARCFRPPHTPNCEYVNYMHQGEERSYEMGFRCCRDQASQPTSAPSAATSVSGGAGTR